MNTSSAHDLETEPEGAGYFLVRGQEDGEPVTVRVHVDPGFLQNLGIEHADGRTVVDVTLSYLLGHQRLDELPSDLDVEEVAAAYDAFEPLLRDRLGAPILTGPGAP